ncbi:MAG: DoxX family membrane protein [Flavobacteriales bacterium]|nr:DoxX family membrane protein [Flavobacteriales bacterium]
MEIELESTAIAFVRISLGIIFLFQAFDKIFTVGLKQFTETIMHGMSRSKIPRNFIRFSSFVSSYIELVGGLFLILGLFLPIVYLILAFNLVMVILSFSFMQPLWDMKHVFPRLVMLVFLMLMPMELDIYSISNIFID